MAKRILLTFANDQKAPLPTLGQEDDRLFELLLKREEKEHFKILRDSHITTKKLGRYLSQFRNDIVLFHYSGHAGRHQLFMEDKPAYAQGLVNFLQRCPNLKLIILNGCSTQGQVQRLLDLDSKPVVIATSSPVDDDTATTFSNTFYEQFCELGKNIQDAFQIALQQAQLSNPDIKLTRSLGTRDGAKSLWGIFPESGSRLQWQLPSQKEDDVHQDWITNEVLINRLLEAFAPHYPPAKTQLDLGAKATEADKIKAILEPLALPISEHLRKLLAPEQLGSDHEFFDQISKGRLKQIVTTYNTLAELLAFILLAGIWDLRTAKKSVTVSDSQAQGLKTFFTLSYDERQAYDFPNLIDLLLVILQDNQAPVFMQELAELPSFTSTSTDFGASVQYLQELKHQSVDAMEASEVKDKCIRGEEMLASFYAHLAFLTQYSIRSVKSIDVQNFRHSRTPSFNHKVVKLIQTFINKLQEDNEERFEFMHTYSVCLLKKGKQEYLNLSPFVIDQNAFGKAKELAKLHYFEVYEKETDSFSYKHVYKPDYFPLETADDHEAYAVIKDQFSDFSKLFFNEPIEKL